MISLASDYRKDVARFKTDEMELLFEPASFASRANIRETLEQLRDMRLTEEKYLSRSEGVASKFSTKLQTDPSPSRSVSFSGKPSP